jgi:hypothetical protein
MASFDAWEICSRLEPGDEEVKSLRDAFAALQWLTGFHRDAFKMRGLRTLIAQEGFGGNVSRMSDDAVTSLVAAQLSSGLLHVRVRRERKLQPQSYSPPKKAEQPMVAAPSRPAPPMPKAVAIDPPTFDPDVDLAAQSGALVAAAAQGAPFCPL